MPKKKSPIKIDTVAGSRSYNRLDMQISQTLHMAIELYNDLNYLFVLDYYDDITLFDLDSDPLAVSYYQMKTSESTITIDSAIKEDWLAKMYAQLNRPGDWLVKELGLITNTPLEVSIKMKNEAGKVNNTKKLLSSEHTPLTNIHENVQSRIIADIAKKNGISENKVDLSKFAHLRTTLTIERHKDLVEKEMEDFLYEKYPKITVDTVKGIYSSLIDLLTKRQEYELLPNNAPFDVVKAHKGFTKSELTRVIDKAIMLSIPTFDDVIKASGLGHDKASILSFSYVQILADSNNNSDGSFPRLFNIVSEIMNTNSFSSNITAWEYGLEIAMKVHEKEPLYKTIYSIEYISVLVICLLINKSRRLP
ncbi:MAG: DUF4297 domain-containing protein [Lachnospiraceae bacterium]|nr:DUF4297 domain-containing protein [Lachnospiraceae bacterium]